MADNPQAFPAVAPRDPELSYPTPGMTLLDYFAGQALAGRMEAFGDFSPNDLEQREIARVSYAMARAMLNERQSHEG